MQLLIAGGDWNVELWNTDAPTERATTQRALQTWELLKNMNIRAPQSTPQEWNKKWTHEKKNGARKQLDSWHMAGAEGAPGPGSPRAEGSFV